MDDEKKKVKTDNIINEEEKEKKKKRILLIILIILMFLISFISYFLGYILGKIDVIPTSGKSSGPSTNTVENNTNVNTETNRNNYPNYNKYENSTNEVINNSKNENNSTNENNSNENDNNKEDIRAVDLIKITEDNINWEVKEKVNVFANRQYNYKTIVAPESVGNYQFMVDNTTEKAVKYDITFTETNTYNINLKYKLKLDNIYIVGNENTWVDVSDLNLSNVILANNSKNLYILEWKWIETTEEQDTLAAGKGYEMFIDVYAEDL